MVFFALCSTSSTYTACQQIGNIFSGLFLAVRNGASEHGMTIRTPCLEKKESDKDGQDITADGTAACAVCL